MLGDLRLAYDVKLRQASFVKTAFITHSKQLSIQMTWFTVSSKKDMATAIFSRAYWTQCPGLDPGGNNQVYKRQRSWEAITSNSPELERCNTAFTHEPTIAMTATDTICQSVLGWDQNQRLAVFKKSNINPVKTKMPAVNQEVITTLWAVILRLSKNSGSGKGL